MTPKVRVRISSGVARGGLGPPFEQGHIEGGNGGTKVPGPGARNFWGDFKISRKCKNCEKKLEEVYRGGPVGSQGGPARSQGGPADAHGARQDIKTYQGMNSRTNCNEFYKA